MKKTKIMYLTLGLGIGIVLSSLIYSIFPKIEYMDLSDEDIIKRAEELGYVSIKEKIIAENEKKDLEKEVEVLSKIQENQEEELNKEENQEEELNKEQEKEDDKQEKKYVEVKIFKGESLTTISKRLFKLGLIDEKDKFIYTVKEKKLDRKLEHGIFRIPLNSDYDDIISILTK